MDPLTVAAISAPIVGGLFGKKGQESANAQNMALAREQMAFQEEQNAKAMQFSADQAGINRQYQERMSNSAYQRSMADMKKAGLNPMLAYMKGGASTPGGATAQGQTSAGAKAEVRNTMEHMANSATNLVGQLANIKKIQAETELITNKKEITDPLAEVTTELTGALTGMRDYFGGTRGSLGANSAKGVLTDFENIIKSVGETLGVISEPGIKPTAHTADTAKTIPKEVMRKVKPTGLQHIYHDGWHYIFQKGEFKSKMTDRQWYQQ